jgi:hypothetical protein
MNKEKKAIRHHTLKGFGRSEHVKKLCQAKNINA